MGGHMTAKRANQARGVRGAPGGAIAVQRTIAVASRSCVRYVRHIVGWVWALGRCLDVVPGWR
jgi:hypothetical protein